MREDVSKILFVGLEDDKEAFFQRAQVYGLIHFIDPKPVAYQQMPEEIQRVSKAIKILRSLPLHEQIENYTHLDIDVIVDAIIDLHDRNQRLLEEQRILTMEIARIEPFGYFSLSDIKEIETQGKCYFQFFSARPTAFHDIPMPNEIVFITSAHDIDYYIGLNDEPFTHDKLTEMQFDHTLEELKQRIKTVQEEHHRLERSLKEYAKYNDVLHHVLVDKLNKTNLYNAQNYVQQTMDGALFAVEGWVPANKLTSLDAIIGPLHIYDEEIAIEENDVVVTCLQNHGLSRLGEDLIHIYDTPSASDKDPSLWVLFGFTLFFAFIIGDAGYGLVYLALALFLRHKYPHIKGVAKRVLNLSIVLFIGCVIWGTLITSFFGMQIAPNNPIRKLSLVHWLSENKAAYHINADDVTHQEWVKKYPELKDVKNANKFVSFIPPNSISHSPEILNRFTDNILFELALFVGVVHLLLSLGRYALRNWQNIGWMCFLIGAYLYFPYYLHVPSLLNYAIGIDLVKGGEFGFHLLLVGIEIAWILSIVRNGWTGIFEITVLIQVFADTLSYLRLYALGLAGAIVGSTINEIASSMPLIVAIVLVVVSHFVNIVLCTMSGIIHGLRLNFLEWYHYSFEGGGRPFRPLKLLKRK